MTHDELCIRAARWLKSQNCGVVFHDKFQPCTPNGELPDAMGFRHGTSILIECKSSRGDFLSDKKKRFRVKPELGMGDWRFYMCEPEIINTDDLPDGWGLLWVKGKQVKKVHGIPSNAQWFTKHPFIGCKMSEMSMMYSALRRMEMHGCLDKIYEKIKPPEGE